ncbi:MAG TPA: 2OG-Fe(II) oxygenase [Caulobacteraceae bacterium]
MAEQIKEVFRLAEAGQPSAVAQLGLWELVGHGVPRKPAAGVRRIIAAAEVGDPLGLHLAGIVDAGGIGTPRNVGRALQWLERLAKTGNARAAEAHRLLSAPGAIEALSAPSERRLEREDPPVSIIDDFLPEWACDYVMRLSGPVLTRGKVVDEAGGESVRGERTNTVMNFGLVDSDVLLELINNRIAEAAGMPPQNAEALGVLHYAPGEQYKPHVDYIPDTPANAQQLAERGQRVRTLLVYLNEGFEGGATEFPRLDLAYKPARGGALIFDSVKADGSVDPLTLHTGAPPTRGEKWVISKWFRSKALRPGPTPAS